MKKLSMTLLILILCSLFCSLAVAQAVEDKAPPSGFSVPDFSEARKARAVLDSFIRAYEAGQVHQLRAMLDPGMIGYQRFIDGVIEDQSRLKQIRLHLLDTQIMAAADVTLIETRWEKRFLATDLRPGLFAGSSRFLMHRTDQGWNLAAIGGDNPFSSQSGVLAQLNLTNASLVDEARVNVEVIDPDMAGSGTLEVQLTYVDSLVPQVTTALALTETTPGRFITLTPFVVRPGEVTLRYLDANPGDGRPPTTLTRTVRVP
ncbi:MAG: hypothetical protein K0A94_02660 [Desulfuromonadales bacterium]|nr:hypothetical protein [Desulfuromonadales bacterium]